MINYERLIVYMRSIKYIIIIYVEFNAFKLIIYWNIILLYYYCNK
mgnify:CR=1 FL=1